MSRPRSLASLLLVLPLVGGCGWLFGISGKTDVDVPLRHDTLLILPFSMPGSSYFQSQTGEMLAGYVKRSVAGACPSASVLGPTDLPESLKERGAETLEPGEVIDFDSVVHVGLQLKARYAMVGEIHNIRSKKPKTFGVLQGAIVVSARVVDTQEKKVVWRVDRREYNYPKKALGGEEMFAAEEDPNEVIRLTMLTAAQGLTEPFAGRDRTLEEDVKCALH